MTTMIQDKDGVIAAAPASVPDRHFRNAWVFDDDKAAITEDVTAAKEIFKEKIREVRIPLLAAEDVTYMKALETSDTSGQTTSAAQKKKLRDAPGSSAITSANSISALKLAWDESLLGTNPYK